MKKYVFIITCLICAFTSIQAQRRLPGQRGLQATYGIADGYGILKNKNLAYHAGVALSHYTGNGNKWIYGIEYMEKRHCYEYNSIPVSQFTAEAGYYYNFLSNRGKDVFCSVGLSGMAGYETSNWGKKTLPDGATLTDQDGFIGGAALTLEVETFVCDRMAVLLNIRERVLFGSSISKFHTQVGIGVKYIF